MDRLLVCGWDEESAPLLTALRTEADLSPVAVGDPHAAHLVRARSATRLHCYQHVHEMLRTVAFDAALMGTSDMASGLATDAAVLGADLLLAGDQMDADALEAAATAAVRHGVALALLRPRLQAAGFRFLTDLLEADHRWAPTMLTIDITGDEPVQPLLRDAVAMASRLTGVPTSVVASVSGTDAEEPAALAAHLRYSAGPLVTLTVRQGTPRLMLSGQAAAGEFDVVSERGQSRVTCSPWQGGPERSVLNDGDGLRMEAARASRARTGDAVDLRLAPGEAAMLRALEASMETGTSEPVAQPGARSSLRLLTGGSALGQSPRAGQLHLV